MNDLSNRYHSFAVVALVKKLREDFDLDFFRQSNWLIRYKSNAKRVFESSYK